jgi:hypothetical protein
MHSIKISNFKFKIIFLLTSCFVILFVFWASISPVKAQNNLPEGITVKPSIMSVDLALDPPEYTLTYINNTDSDIKLELSVQDFTELEEGYKISFLEGKDAENYKYSLSSWISFENENLELIPGQEKSVKVFIDDQRITLGGHYASILARAIQQNVEKEINLNPVLSSLLFVRASTGREIENGDISTLRPERNFINFPDNFILRFQNSGNVHVVPYGKLIITDMLGNQVATGILNEGSLNALPESIRRYDIPIIANSKFMLPGIYTAKIDMNFGKSKKELSRTTIFFSQGSLNFLYFGIIPIVIAILLLILRRRMKKGLRKQKVKS